MQNIEPTNSLSTCSMNRNLTKVEKHQSLLFDITLFENDLTNYDISEEERIEMLQILWDMMVACADMGWGIEPTQTICTKLIQDTFDDTLASFAKTKDKMQKH